MNNKSIIHLLQITAKLLSLHGANPFQIKHYTNAALFLERLDKEVDKLSPQELRLIPGINNGVIALIEEIQTTDTLQRYQGLIEKTPVGVLSMLALAGLGPKKVSILWQELGIQTIDELEEACKLGKVAQLPGFGEKTQASILESLSQRKKYLNKFHYATALRYANLLEVGLNDAFPQLIHTPVGAFRRKMEIVTGIDWLIAAKNIAPIIAWLDGWQSIQQIKSISGPFSWRGYFIDNNLPLHILFCTPEDFQKEIIIQTGSAEHLGIMLENGKTLGQQINQTTQLNSEAEGYQQAGLPYIFPELREGIIEMCWVKSGAPMLLETTDLKGIFHSHTKYSDGQNSLEGMVTYCKDLGYSYIGITDHSQTAAYAGGMRPLTIQEQHNSIDRLNQQLAPFKIFKGIEADILPDGSLDYSDEILSKFDFIIASVHMGLNMNEQKATDRLIKAISNPFTTMLGHPTGRLLLRREGYPIHHKAVIDACAAYGVIIEINASPWRLDLDWRWVPYAIEKGVKLSINPDAHHQDEIYNIRYGVYVGRKGGLTQQHTFNTFTREEVESYFQKRKMLALQVMQNL